MIWCLNHNGHWATRNDVGMEITCLTSSLCKYAISVQKRIKIYSISFLGAEYLWKLTYSFINLSIHLLYNSLNSIL